MKQTSELSKWQYYSLQWKRGLVRAYCRFLFRISYYFSPARAFNVHLLVMPNELIPETLIRFGAQIGQDTTIMPPLHMHNMGKHSSDHFSNLVIGSQCYLGPKLFIDLQEQVTIADNATISMGVSLLTHIDVGHSPLGEHLFPADCKPIVIEKGAYIGAGAIVLKGVTIGECAVIGAGCVVTKDVPPWSVVVGGTSRIIRHLE